MDDSELSETSKREAREFARLHKLDRRTTWALAQLLEKTWQDGVSCEQTMQFLERDIIPRLESADKH